MTVLAALLPSLTSLCLATPRSPSRTPRSPRKSPVGFGWRPPAPVRGTRSSRPSGPKYTHLIDLEGNEVHRWTSEFGPSAVYLLDDGSILRCARLEDNPTFSGGGICGRIERIGWDGELLWAYEIADEYQTQHHDARPMPNGNVLLIVWEHRFYEDCIAVGRDPAATPDKGLWPDAVLEVKPVGRDDGEIVWEWHAWDHLIQDFDPDADFYGSIPDEPGRIDINYDHRDAPAMTAEERRRQEELEAQMRALGYVGGDEEEDDGTAAPAGRGTGSDWMHTNAVDYHPELDLIALSSRR